MSELDHVHVAVGPRRNILSLEQLQEAAYEVELFVDCDQLTKIGYEKMHLQLVLAHLQKKPSDHCGEVARKELLIGLVSSQELVYEIELVQQTLLKSRKVGHIVDTLQVVFRE